MKIGLSQTQFFDDEGLPLVAGRVSVWQRDSDIPVDVFTYDGNNYVQADNPTTLDDAGRLETLFFDVAIVRVKVEKMNGDGTYATVEIYEDGFDMPSTNNDTILNGIAELKAANTALGVVAVYGYDANCVAPLRYYVWDGQSTTPANDGTVVVSTGLSVGRWLLLWDDEKLPCTVFGITPGHETNISAFLDYGDFVGRWSIRMPPVRRFLSGIYTSNTTFSASSVVVYFDRGASFTNAKFNILRALVDSNSNYIADFSFGDTKFATHSSWFRTAQAFVSCGSKHLVFDIVDYFQDLNIGDVVTISNTIVECTHEPPQLTFTSGRYILFDNCHFVGTPLRISGYYRFTDCVFSDKYFVSHSASDFDFASKITVPHAYNVVNVTDFVNPDVYVRWALQQQLTEINLQDRTCGGFTCNAYVANIKNLTSTGTIVTSGDLMLERVNAIIKPDANNITSRESSVAFVVADNAAESINVFGGLVSGDVNATQAINLYDCIFTATASIDPTISAVIKLERVTVNEKASAETFGGKHLFLKGCTIHRTVDIRPDWSGSYYYFDVVIDGNLFLDDGWLNFNANNDPLVYEIGANWFTITNNTFDGNGDIAMPYWAPAGQKFLTSGIGFVYSGNSGGTIMETGPESFNSTTMTRTHTFDGKDYNITVDTWRVFNLDPNDVFQRYRSKGGETAFRLGGYADGAFGEPVKSYAETLVHNKAISIVNNDQFLVAEAWADQDGYASGKYIFFGD